MNSLNHNQDILDRTFQFAVRVTKLRSFLDSRPGTSVGSQVEEAQAAESAADFISKMCIGLKEARETHYRLRILGAANLVRPTRLAPLIKEADEIKRIAGAIIVRTKANARAVNVRRR